MDWNDLRYVLAVARERTLLHAAASLGVSHTTVGRRLKALEDDLGAQLFQRTPEGLVPTAAGHDLIEVAERVEDDVLAVEGRVRGQDARLRGRLLVSTFRALFHVHERVFASFVERYPHVSLTLEFTGEAVSLPRREADVVLRLSNAPPDTLVGRRVGPVQFGVYASTSLARRLGPDASLGDFPWIGRDGGPNHRWFEGWMARHAPGARRVLVMDYEPVAVAHAVGAGIGAQILPCFLADPNPDLTRIAPLDPTFQLDLWVLTLAGLRTNSRVRAFMDHVAEALGLERDALAGTSPAGGG